MGEAPGGDCVEGGQPMGLIGTDFGIPGVIQDLRTCLEDIGRLRYLPYDLEDDTVGFKTRISDLIEALETGGQGAIGNAASPLAFTVFHLNRGRNARLATGSEPPQRRRFNIFREGGKIIERARQAALKALMSIAIIAPQDDPTYDLWVAKITRPDALAREILPIMGERVAGTRFSPREIADIINERRPEGAPKVVGNVVGKALRFLVDASVGTEFEVCFEKEGPQTFYFHIRSTSVGAIDDEDLISVKRWAADFYIPKKHGNPEKLLGHMTDRPLGTVITPQDIARETYGLDDPVRGDINRIVTHMSQVVLRSERSWGDKLARAEKAAEISGESVTEAKMRRAREDFTIRRIRNGKGGSMTAGYRLMNRYEAMEQWIAGIALPGYLLEKILWKMLEYPLGTEFTTKQIAELLVSDGVQVTPHRVVDALMKRGGIVKKTAETEFEVEAERRATGQHAREYHFSIRP